MIFVCTAHAEGFQTSSEDVTWTEIGGLSWSNALDGRYQNIDLDGTSPIALIVQKSPATEACSAIGGELPSNDDFNKLGADYTKLLGAAGLELWSSTVSSPYPTLNIVGYTLLNGTVTGGTSRTHKESVVCIRRATDIN